jgi:hypothetical protein
MPARSVTEEGQSKASAVLALTVLISASKREYVTPYVTTIQHDQRVGPKSPSCLVELCVTKSSDGYRFGQA